MKKYKNILLILLIMIMILSVLKTASMAVEDTSFNVNISSSKKEIEAGELITIKLDVSDIKMGDYGINTLEGILEYDEEIFEKIDTQNIQAQSGWSVAYNSESNSLLNGKFLATNLTSGIKDDATIFEIAMKTKEDIEEGNTKIVFKDLTSNNGKGLVSAGTKEVEISIKNREKTKSSTISSEENNERNKSEINSKVIIAVIVIVLVLLGIIVIKSKKRKENKKRR